MTGATSHRVRILDLFCRDGGAGAGYARAGFDVVGVDIEQRPSYPYPFVQADALEYLEEYVLGAVVPPFDAIHASPPCQLHSRTRRLRSNPHPELIGPTRELLEQSGLPWVIENVPGSPLRNYVVLCGTSFGLGIDGFELRRHRWFESNVPMMVPKCRHHLPAFPVFGQSVNTWFREKYGRTFTNNDRRRVLEAPWLAWDGIGDAIPPAYTEHIGRYLLEHIESQVAA